MSRKLTKEQLKQITAQLEEEKRIEKSLKKTFPEKPKNNKEQVFEKWDFLKVHWKTGWSDYKFPFKNLERSEKDFFQKYIYCYTIPKYILFNSRAMTASIVSGESFYKQWKYLFTKKESHEFLNLKSPYLLYINLNFLIM
jgi:hypothetical protein